MPELSRFNGIVVKMLYMDNVQHNKPHIHAEYGEHSVVVSLDGDVIEGGFPRNKMKLLVAWIEIHREDLESNWKLLSKGEQYFRIDPLK